MRLLFLLIFLNSNMLFSIENPTLRVMSFNIRYDEPSDGKHAWPHRRDGVVNMLDFHHIDLAGLQEVLKRQLDDFNRLAPHFSSIGVGRTDGKTNGEFAPIIFHPGRIELLDWGTFWLSETPEVVGSQGWDAALERICTWGKFKVITSGQEFIFLNTHFDHRGDRARLNSARLIAQHIQQFSDKLPIIVVGDFNATPQSEPITAILNAGPIHSLTDAKTHSGHPVYGPAGTYTGFTIEPKTIPTIDYIFVNQNVAVAQFGIISELWNGVLPSDHRPVVAEMSF